MCSPEPLCVLERLAFRIRNGEHDVVDRIGDRTIDVHIRALRRKMGEAADLIETVRGVGYRFRE